MVSTNSNPLPDRGDDYMEDDLFDYDAEIAEIDTTIRAPAPIESKKDTLGIDEEVKIRKKRIIVKLDEARLMSKLGIPKLRQEAPQKLKFKGKGHEYHDTARLLSYYQFWADDLYKKAKFRDTLKIVEKLGHSRSMREQRLSWIEETKRRDKHPRTGNPGGMDSIADVTGGEADPKNNEGAAEDNQNDDDLYSLPQSILNTDLGGASGQHRTGSSGALFLSHGDEDTSDDDFGAGPDDDELDVLMGAGRVVGPEIILGNPTAVRGGKNSGKIHASSLGGDTGNDGFGAGPGDDELDALMDAERGVVPKNNLINTAAAQDGSVKKDAIGGSVALEAEFFADEMEAMEDLDW